MRRIDARRLVAELPDQLEALVICERNADAPTVRVCAAGDIGFSGRLAALPAGDRSPFREVAPLLRSADLAFANLETPFVDGDPAGRLFAAPAAAASHLAAAGFSLLNLANNHILDYGPEALTLTCQALAEAGIEVLGAADDADSARRLVTKDLAGARVGWLGCARTLKDQDPAAPGFWEYDPDALLAAVGAARGTVDVVVVSIHMGYMYLDYPDPAQRRQVLDLLDAGADLVLLHHAHVLQGIEKAKNGGVACYSLGNFLLDWKEGTVVVDQMLEEQRCGGLFLFDLDRRGVAKAAVLPVRVDDDWTVRWALGDDGQAILDRLERISDWGSDVADLFYRQRAERNTGLVFRSILRSLRRGELRSVLELLPRLRPQHFRMAGRWLASRLGSGR